MGSKPAAPSIAVGKRAMAYRAKVTKLTAQRHISFSFASPWLAESHRSVCTLQQDMMDTDEDEKSDSSNSDDDDDDDETSASTDSEDDEVC